MPLLETNGPLVIAKSAQAGEKGCINHGMNLLGFLRLQGLFGDHSLTAILSSTMTVAAPTLKDVFTLGAGLFLFATARFVVNYIRHPLRKFPGPFLAGATFWYRAYYDIWRDGEFLFHLKDLHEKYGMPVSLDF